MAGMIDLIGCDVDALKGKPDAAFYATLDQARREAASAPSLSNGSPVVKLWQGPGSGVEEPPMCYATCMAAPRKAVDGLRDRRRHL